MTRLALAVLMVLVASPAAATPELDEALRTANQLRKGLDYEAALQHAQRARKLAANRVERRDAAMLTGVLLYELGRIAEAKAAFREALSADVGATAPSNVSPKLLEDFERERAAVRRRATKGTAPSVSGGTKLDDDDAVEPPADPRVEAKSPTPIEPEVAAQPVQPDAAATSAAPAGVQRSEPPTPVSRVAGLALLAAGVVGLGTGVAFMVDAQGAAGAINRADEDMPISRAWADQLKARGQTSQRVGAVALGVGGALAAAGLLLTVLAPGAPEVAVNVTPGGAALVYSGRF